MTCRLAFTEEGDAALSDKSRIEWTDATWNPVTGCSKVSPGCAHCYAETLSLRFGWSQRPWLPVYAHENVVLHPERLAGLGDARQPPPVGRRRRPRSAEIEPPGLDLDVLRSGARRDALALAARLGDEARAVTLDVLGDTESATSMMARRLRATVSDDAGPG